MANRRARCWTLVGCNPHSSPKITNGQFALSWFGVEVRVTVFRIYLFLVCVALVLNACSNPGASRESEVTAALSPSASGADSLPICGKLDDKQIHIPLNWESFRPPRAGQSYVDPAFGCSVKRLTDSSSDETAWDGKHVGFMNYYSTLTALNGNDSMLFIVSNDGTWRIKNVNGGLAIPAAKMPQFSGHPVWDASDGSAFYYAFGNSLYKANISGAAMKSKLLHAFSEYKAIVSPDAADLSQDGDHVALVGQNSSNTLDAFVWSLRNETKTSIYTTVCTIHANVSGASQPGCIHKLQLTADNLLTIQFLGDGEGTEQGLRLWNGIELLHLQDHTNHYDTGYDLSGKPIFIAENNASTLVGLKNPCASGWGLDVRQISHLPSAACLLDHEPYWHVSYRGGSTQPGVALSFFDDRKPGPELFATNTQYEAPVAVNWKLYEDEIVLATIDGRSIYRLAHARSRSAENYWAQPHAAISRDGRYVIFTSNMAFPNGCPQGMHVDNECSDVYLIHLR